MNYFQSTCRAGGLRLCSFLLLAFFAISIFSSCDSHEGSVFQRGPSISTSTSTTLGTYLTDSLGFTLYSFANDFNEQNNCTGGCATLWPTYYAGDFITQQQLGAGLDIADFGTITTAGGQKQTTYKKWPLYHYAPPVNGVNTREGIGDTRGEGVAGFWHVAKPDYTIRLINAQLVGLDGKSYKSDYTEGAGKTLYFTDARGATLYHFSRDSFNINKFTRADLSNNGIWPVYETTNIVVPSTLDKTLFGTITVFGKRQLTYKGWPMYYYGADNKQRGSTKGVSVAVPGTWPVVVKDAAGAPKP